MDGSRDLLLITLEAAVPLWIEKVRGWSEARRTIEAAGAAELICSKGDVLQFGGGKPGEAANAFNALAKSLALLSFVSGGVKFAGLRWESK